MPREHPPATASTLTGLFKQIGSTWRQALLRLGAVWLFLILLFLPDWRAMAAQWWDSSTYNHILLIPAILAWLVWMRARDLARLEPRCWWPGGIVLAFAGLIWLLGAFAGLSIARQAGAVALLPASLLLILGPRVAAGLVFPLAYMAFLVPFGDELVPPLQMITAELTIGLTHLSGIPAQIDGVYINTPAGLFVVAEACSGVKFLIAMIALGVLVAHVCFRSWTRRLAFLAVSIVVPILANGVRAWGTIYVAQSMGAEYATGFDHIVYGWLFFAVVIALVLGLSWRFFDRLPQEPFIDPEAIAKLRFIERIEGKGLSSVTALLLVLVTVLGVKAWADAAQALAAPIARQIDFAPVTGWSRVDFAPSYPWEPRATGAEHRLLGSFANGKGATVDVFFALYASQGEGKEAGGFGEGALPPQSDWHWAAPGPQTATAKSERLMGRGVVDRLAQTTYRTGDLLTGSNARLKLANMVDRVLLRKSPTMLLIISAESRPNVPAQAAVDEFRRSIGPIDVWMDRTAQVR